MKIITEIKTRICYWQEKQLLEIYYEPFDGIIRCIDVPAPEIHLTQNINVLFPCPIIIDKVRDETSEQLVLMIYPTPKD